MRRPRLSAAAGYGVLVMARVVISLLICTLIGAFVAVSPFEVIEATEFIEWLDKLFEDNPAMMTATVSQAELGFALFLLAEAQLELGENTKDRCASFIGIVSALAGVYVLVSWFFGW